MITCSKDVTKTQIIPEASFPAKTLSSAAVIAKTPFPNPTGMKKLIFVLKKLVLRNS